jgi:8-oxo-dGTP diphosphatase
LTALSRELDEELGCSVIAVGTTALGIFEAAAVNEPGRRVCAAVYSAAIEGSIAPRGEIAEIVWVDATKPITVCLAPLTRDCILPVVQAGGRIDPHASRQYMARAIPASGEGDDR